MRTSRGRRGSQPPVSAAVPAMSRPVARWSAHRGHRSRFCAVSFPTADVAYPCSRRACRSEPSTTCTSRWSRAFRRSQGSPHGAPPAGDAERGADQPATCDREDSCARAGSRRATVRRAGQPQACRTQTQPVVVGQCREAVVSPLGTPGVLHEEADVVVSDDAECVPFEVLDRAILHLLLAFHGSRKLHLPPAVMDGCGHDDRGELVDSGTGGRQAGWC